MNAIAIAGAVISASLAAAHAVADAPVNLALGRPVSVVAGSPSGAAPSTLTDGVFRPEGTQWQTGTVWWSGTGVMLEIGFEESVELSGAIVQGDNNDSYRMWYRDIGSGSFLELWTIGALGGPGMRTRPNPADRSEIHFFAAPVVTDAIRIAAIGGDGSYSLSEVQAWGAVPAPGAIALLAAAGACGPSRRRAA